jgi:hypothetical protein
MAIRRLGWDRVTIIVTDSGVPGEETKRRPRRRRVIGQVYLIAARSYYPFDRKRITWGLIVEN